MNGEPGRELTLHGAAGNTFHIVFLQGHKQGGDGGVAIADTKNVVAVAEGRVSIFEQAQRVLFEHPPLII